MNREGGFLPEQVTKAATANPEGTKERPLSKEE
jgi:hypothetical protein